MHIVTRSIIGLALLTSSGGAAAIMITGSIDGAHVEFYRQDIWQIISDITPDTRAEKKLLSRSDRKFIRQLGIYQKNITSLQNKAGTRGLNENQANRLLKREDGLVQLLNSRNLLDPLLLAGLDASSQFVPGDQTDSTITDYSSQEPPRKASAPEPSTLTLLALGLLFLGLARSKHAYRPAG